MEVCVPQMAQLIMTEFSNNEMERDGELVGMAKDVLREGVDGG